MFRSCGKKSTVVAFLQQRGRGPLIDFQNIEGVAYPAMSALERQDAVPEIGREQQHPSLLGFAAMDWEIPCRW